MACATSSTRVCAHEWLCEDNHTNGIGDTFALCYPPEGNHTLETTSNQQPPYLIFIAYAVFIAIGMVSGLLNIAWTYIQESFGVTLDYLGILLTVGILGGLVAAFMSGAIIGRFGLRRMLLAGTLLAALGYAGIGLSPVWLILLAFAFIASLGKGALDAGMNNFVSANYGTSQMNWLHACWGIGLTFAPALVTFIVVQYGQSWRLSYILMTGALLLLSGAILLTYGMWHMGTRESKRKVATSSTHEQTTPAEAEVSISDTLRQPAVLLSILLFFVYGGIEIGTGQLANTLLVQSRGIAQEVSGAWVSFYWGSFTIGRMLVGFLSLRMGDKPLIFLSLGIAFVGTFLLMIHAHETLSFIGLLMIGFGLAPKIGRAHV